MMTVQEATFPSRTLACFVDTLAAELGRDTLAAVFAKADLPASLLDSDSLARLDDQVAAKNYADVLRAARAYYGRGARGIMLRVGKNMWVHLLESASLQDKTRANAVRALPVNLRRRAILDMVARFMGSRAGDVSIHSLDLDWMLVDRSSPAALAVDAAEPVCYITQGLIQEALYWSTGEEHIVEEVACRATGSQTCEFKIKTGA
jgi:predicted hydrocarbon binding protein